MIIIIIKMRGNREKILKITMLIIAIGLKIGLLVNSLIYRVISKIIIINNDLLLLLLLNFVDVL